MTGKSKRELEEQITLLEKHIEKLNSDNKTLAVKYEELEKRSRLQKPTSNKFKCNLCDQLFESRTDLRTHKEAKHVSNLGTFQCELCDQWFDLDWKYNAHMKNHKQHQCNYCEKSFKRELYKTRHITAVHEDLKIFCHYFNNNKICPFNNQCIFLHEPSTDCKYGSKCERINCMYKHDKPENDNDDISEQHDILDNAIIAENEHNDIEDQTTIIDINETFENPSQEAMKQFKCDKCDFEAEFIYLFQNHTAGHHPLYCCRCKLDFVSKTQCRKHKEKAHSIKSF